MSISQKEAEEIQAKIDKMGPSGGPRTLAQGPPPTSDVELDPESLPAKVSPGQRRCPFLQTYSEAEGYDVDALCTVRIQTFSPSAPYGPLSPEVCSLCIKAKTFSIEEDKWDAIQEADARGRETADEDSPEEPADEQNEED